MISPVTLSPEKTHREIQFSNSNLSYNLKEPFEYKQASNLKEELEPKIQNIDHYQYNIPTKTNEEYKTNPYSDYDDEFKRNQYLAKDYQSFEKTYSPQKPPSNYESQNIYHQEEPNPYLHYDEEFKATQQDSGKNHDFKQPFTPNKPPGYPNKPLDLPPGYQSTPHVKDKISKIMGKEISSPDNDFKSQLPHHKEKSQKLNVITNEEGNKKVFPILIESRKKINEDSNNPDKGFYNEGLSNSKEPPKKVNFNVNSDSNANPFASGINIEDVKNNATFSKHIFEDPMILDILEKKAGTKSRTNNDDFEFGKDALERGSKRNILTEKKGKIVVEKGENPADPYARLGHIIFKLMSLVSYLVLSNATAAANIIYQAVIVFSALDFWIVKNVSGR